MQKNKHVKNCNCHIFYFQTNKLLSSPKIKPKTKVAGPCSLMIGTEATRPCPTGCTTCCDGKETTVQSEGFMFASTCCTDVPEQKHHHPREYNQKPTPPQNKSIYVINSQRISRRTKSLIDFTHTEAFRLQFYIP